MRDPRVVQRYLDKLDEYFLKEDSYYRMDNIHQRTTASLRRSLETDYEEVVKIWSPTYKKVMLTLLYWQMRKKTQP